MAPVSAPGDPARFEGRTVIVTGASGGIGLAIARNFGNHGAFVLAHGFDPADRTRVVDDIESVGGKARYLAGDLTAESEPERIVDAAREANGHVDVVVNNAGANVFAGTLETDAGTWKHCLDLDLRASWLLAKAAAPFFSSSGAIVNIASNHATSTMPGVFPYNVAKAGMLALTQSLAIELATAGVRVNAICPGYIDTPANVAYFDTFPEPAVERRRVERLHPLCRIGAPDDVAHAVMFLADPQQAGFITGTVLAIDGGRSALMQDPNND